MRTPAFRCRHRALFLVAAGLVAASPAVADTAEYRLTFTTGWSDPAVPGEHFSPLIGGTHNDEVAFWRGGSLATLGVERMAETGNKTTLQNEVQIQVFQGRAREVICGPGIDSPGQGTTTFTVSEAHPLATVVTMIAPSPDWFVGVSGLSLRDDAGWIHDLTVDLHPYDAGTDSGAFFTSPNLSTSPPEPIAEITDGSLFDPLVVGTFRFQRLVDCDENGIFDIDEIAIDPSLDGDGDGMLDACDCRADVAGGDGVVDFSDLLAVLANWGGDGAGAGIAEPLDVVDFGDVVAVLSSFGPCL